MALVDAYGRHIDYLRISITDQCNLNCGYCMPVFSGRFRQKRSEILTYEEVTQVAEAAVAAGITKIRVTGGEPLVRKGVVDFCRMLGGIRGLETLAITTNGVRLGALADALRAAGVKRVNISLDTLNRARFKKITGHDRLLEVLAGIERAEAVGFEPVKINTVVMRGVNDDEIAPLAGLTRDKPYQVRFIELMPFHEIALGDYRDLYMPISEIFKQIPGIERARICPATDSGGPARLCSLPGARGTIGFIAPLSWHFCGSCNRLRLTADGKIRTCLFSDEEVDIKSPLRNGVSKIDLIELLRKGIARKPQQHHLDDMGRAESPKRGMRAIGG